MADNLVALAGFAVIVMLIVYNIRRRRRMTPEQRMAEDQLRETRRLRRAVERQDRY